MFATIKLYKTGVATPETGTETDLDGNYSISNLDEGIYDIKVSYVGYGEKTVTKVKIENGKITILNIALEEGLSDCGFVFKYVEPLIRFDNTSSGRVYKAEDLRRSPIKN
mgnify:CR=1 FL=1